MATKKTATKTSSKPRRNPVRKTAPKRRAAAGVPAFKATKLKLLRPVPSDIEIAQAANVKPILQVARELGIREDELELYGPFKAKVKLEILERDRKSVV